MPATTTYLSLGAFYAADKRRDISREHDIGLWWLGEDWHAPRFRAAWVEQTGELYVMQHEGTPGGGRIDVVAQAATLEELEGRLDGWRDAVGERGSLRWFVERLGPDVPAHLLLLAGLAPPPDPSRFKRPAAADVA
jgi:hypothetical protein